MTKITNISNQEALAKIQKDRKRTNILRNIEQPLIAFFVQRIPRFISSDMLTAIGFLGSLMTFGGFVLASCFSKYWLLVSILGFGVNWFGDSLDGRIAYFRNCPRKWYGFSLDLCTDWITAILIGSGFMIYEKAEWEFLGFIFTVLYGLAIMIALLRYKIVNVYSIDSGLLGPTEVRVIISLIILAELFFPGVITYCCAGACLLLGVINVIDFVNLLKMADNRDKEEKKEKEAATIA